MGTTDTQIAIKFTDIAVPDGLNVRSDLPAIEKLAQSLKNEGQLTPIVVRKSPAGASKPYMLISGRRRMAAFSLNKWEMREVLAVVREYAANDVLGPIIDNWTENAEREEVDTLDNAERVHQLLTGTYYVLPGQEAKPLTPEIIAQKLNLGTTRQVQKLAKIFRDVDPDVARSARKVGAPSWLWIKLSQMTGEGETKDKKLESRAKIQMALLDSWIETRKALEAAGRQRSEREDKGKKKKKGKKVEESGWGAIDPDLPIDKKDRTAANYFDLVSKMATQSKDKSQAERAAGARDVMRLMSGEIQRLPWATEADWEVYAPEPTEEEGEEESAPEEKAAE